MTRTACRSARGTRDWVAAPQHHCSAALSWHHVEHRGIRVLTSGRIKRQVIESNANGGCTNNQ
jgi:hypothetical protein